MSALEDVLRDLLQSTRSSRVTLRRDLPGESAFPVVAEALAPGVGSLREERSVHLPGQPVVLEMLRGRQVVQDDAAAAYDDPAFQRMLEVYGGLGAQIVTPVMRDGKLEAIVSVHQLARPETVDRRRDRGSDAGSRARGGAPVRIPATDAHNRWHPDIEPVAVVAPGDVVTLETRDGLDGQLTRESAHADCARFDDGLPHPLTGPLFVDGAEAGDVLEVELLEYETPAFGVNCVIPGFGFLADIFTEPFLVPWELDGAVARSTELPGIAVPACVHAGVIGVAPSYELMEAQRAREERIRAAGGDVAGAAPESAIPPAQRAAFARSRRARPAATSTSGGSSPARRCCCRCTSPARCSRSATSTSPRATARSAARGSRSRLR